MLRNVPQQGLRPLQIIYRHFPRNGKNEMGRDVCLLHQEHNEHPEQKLELEYRNSLEERECKNTQDDKPLSGCLHPVVISS